MKTGLFSRPFDFELPTVVNFVGGGGKTGLILALLEEFAGFCSLLYTTTTRIHPPAVAHGLAIIACDNAPLHKSLLESCAYEQQRPCAFVATRPAIAADLLKGVEPDFADSLRRDLFPLILNEADGARSMSIKMPRDGEPVLMSGAGYLVPVIGMDCLCKPLGPDVLFRWEIARRRCFLKTGQLLIPELAAILLMHPQGVCKDWKPGMRIIPYINKVDTPGEDSMAQELAAALLQNRTFPVERVVWGSLFAKRAGSLCAPLQ
jgi:probable selenium-dependent hydroxylase accessory protein YqeC